jgi:acyl carrier protein
MNKKEIYDNAFLTTFNISEVQLTDLKYQDADWDSVGHMSLMTMLEDEFGIEMNADDIIDFSSYQKGKEIMANYGIEL